MNYILKIHNSNMAINYGVMRSVLLYGAKSWVLTETTSRRLSRRGRRMLGVSWLGRVTDVDIIHRTAKYKKGVLKRETLVFRQHHEKHEQITLTTEVNFNCICRILVGPWSPC